MYQQLTLLAKSLWLNADDYMGWMDDVESVDDDAGGSRRRDDDSN